MNHRINWPRAGVATAFCLQASLLMAQTSDPQVPKIAVLKAQVTVPVVATAENLQGDGLLGVTRVDVRKFTTPRSVKAYINGLVRETSTYYLVQVAFKKQVRIGGALLMVSVGGNMTALQEDPDGMGAAGVVYLDGDPMGATVHVAHDRDFDLQRVADHEGDTPTVNPRFELGLQPRAFALGGLTLQKK